MISPSPESEQPPMYPTTHDEPLPIHPCDSSPDPSVKTFGEWRKGLNFGGFVPGEEMGERSFGGSSCAEGTVEFSLSAMKDGELFSDFGNGLPADGFGGGGGGGSVLGSIGGVSAGMVVLDEFSGTNRTGGVSGGSDEIFLLEMKDKLVVGDLEDGFAEDGGGSRREREISLLELKKKQLLCDLENGCVFGEVVGARALENEDGSEGTVVLDKFCDADGKKKVERGLLADVSGKMKGGEGGNNGFDLRRTLKIEVIDDTAVVEQVPIREVCGMVKNENRMPSDPKNQKEEMVDRKKARRARRKAKSLHRNEELHGKQEDVNAPLQKSQTGHKLMYSRVEMEGLRYVNVEEQLRFWSQVYDGLGPVAKEYMSLLSERAQPGSNVDCLRQSLRRERAPGILGAMDGSGRGNHTNIFLPPNIIKPFYDSNWSYVS